MTPILFTECEIGNVDLIFMIDTSGSIRDCNPHGFQLMLDFITNIIQFFTIGFQESLVGVILFSNDATLQFNVKTYTNINDLLTAVYSLPYHGGFTNTAAALELLLNSAQDGTMGLRSGYPHIAVLITDGVATERADETIPMAERVLRSNIFQAIYAIGISSEVNVNELHAITGNPSHVLESASFAALDQLRGAVSQGFCGGELLYDHVAIVLTMKDHFKSWKVNFPLIIDTLLYALYHHICRP